MAFFHRNTIGQRKLTALFSTAIILWAFLVYVYWLADQKTLESLWNVEFDILMHIIGGVFLALLYEWVAHNRRLAVFLVSVLFVTVSWEVVEYFFNTDVRTLFTTHFDLWLLDSLGDVVAAFLGGYGYWAFCFSKQKAAAAPAATAKIRK